ncbi:MAG: CNP1-like family protein [Pseudomonadota bacterium]
MRRFSLAPSLLAALLLGATNVGAQWLADPSDWKEAEAPPPPAFELKRLVRFEGPAYSSLQFAVDPATMAIGKDGVVRYVVVITSSSGTVNAMYEGIRCVTGEFKTYARHNPDSGWNKVQNAEWKSVFATSPSQHTLRLAKQGVCTNAAPASSVDAMVRELKNPYFSP